MLWTRLLGMMMAVLCLAVPSFLQAQSWSAPSAASRKRQLPPRFSVPDLTDAAPDFTNGPSMQLTPLTQPNGWILIFQPDSSGSVSAKQAVGMLGLAAASVDARIVSSFNNQRGTVYALLESDQEPDPSRLPPLLAKQGTLKLVPNVRYRLSSNTFPGNDPMADRQWGLLNQGQPLEPGAGAPQASAHIDLAGAWQQQTSSDSVVVAVLDTGIDYEHPDLAANMWVNPGEIAGNDTDDDQNGFVDDVHGFNFSVRWSGRDTAPRDLIGHGTHVAGIIGAVADNGIGISGVTQKVQLMACGVFDSSGYTDDYILAKGIEYAVSQGADIINASLGGPLPGAALQAAIRHASEAGVLFVTSSGNNGYYLGSRFPDIAAYPAQFDLPNILTVAATDNTDQLAAYSNFGETAVDLGAPGSSVLSTLPALKVIWSEDFDAVPEGTLPEGWRAGGERNTWGVHAALVGDSNRALRADDREAFPYRGDSDGWVDLPEIRGEQVGSSFHSVVWFSMDISASMSEGSQLVLELIRDGGSSVWINLDADYHAYNGRHYARLETRLPPILFETLRLRLHWRAAPADDTHFGVEIDNLRFYQIADQEARFAGKASYEEAYGVYSGTSMAAPHVAGVAALLKAEKPTMSFHEWKMRLITTGQPLPALKDKTASGRRLNAAEALSAQGGLQWLDDATDREVRVGDTYPLVWSHLDAPDTDTALVLLHQGQPLPETRVSLHETGGVFAWHVPDVAPGDGYQLQLESPSETVVSATFAIHPFSGAEINDPALAGFLTESLDQNDDQRLSQRELLRYRGPLVVTDLGVVDYSGLNVFSEKVSFLVLYSNKASVLPDLARFNRLKTLIMAGVRVTELDGLPPGLETLQLQEMPLVRLATLPESVRDVALQNLSLRVLPDLPGELNSLLLNTLPLEGVGRWPDRIGACSLSHLSLTRLPSFHQKGEDVFIDNLPLRELPSFPPEIRTLTLWRTALRETPDLDYLALANDVAIEFNPNLQHLGALPPQSERLSLRENALRELPTLPETVGQLYASNNALTRLPDPLPPFLDTVFVAGNRLTALPSLSESLAFLDVSRNQLTELPDLTRIPFLIELNASENQLRRVDQLPFAVEGLNLAANQLSELAALPENLMNLNLSGNQLTQLPAWPDSIYLAFLDLSNNRLTEPPLLPEGDGTMCLKLDGNDFDEADCDLLYALAGLNPQGCSFSEINRYSPQYDVLDGFVAVRDRNRTFLTCSDVGSDSSVHGLTATRSRFDQVTLRWLPGGPAGHSLAGYVVYREHAGRRELAAFTRETQAVVRFLPGATGQGQWRVVPVDETMTEYDSLAGTITFDAPESADQTANRMRYPILSRFGVTRHELSLRGPGNTLFLGGLLTVFDEAGSPLAEQILWGLSGISFEAFALEDLLAPEVVVAGTTFELKTFLPTEVAVTAYQANDRFRIPRHGEPSFGGFLGLAPEWLSEEQVTMALTVAGEQSAAINLTWYDQLGLVLGETRLDLAAGHTLFYEPLQNLPQGVQMQMVGAVRWTSDQPVAAAAVYVENESWQPDVFVEPVDGRATLQGVFPAYGHFVRIANPGSQRVWVAFDLIDREGRRVSRRTTTVAPHSSALWNTDAAFLTEIREQTMLRQAYWRFEASHPVQVAMEISGHDVHGAFFEANFENERIAPLTIGRTLLSSDALQWSASVKTSLWLLNTEAEAGQVRLFFYGERLSPAHALTLPIAASGRLELDGTTLLDHIPAEDLPKLRKVQILAEGGVLLNGTLVRRDLISGGLTAHPFISD